MALNLKSQLGKAKVANEEAPSADATLGVKRKGKASTLHYSKILDRWAEDTRPLDPEHVEALAESILALNKLIQPIAIDIADRLIAGGHRRAAIHKIFQSRKKSVVEARDRIFPLGQVPVHRLDLDSSEDEAGALAAEAAENEKRKDYKASEVKAIARKLEALGYERTVGKPRKGSKSLIKALSSITKKSRSSLYRDLEEEKAPSLTDEQRHDRKIESAVKAIQIAATSKSITEEESLVLLEIAKQVAGYLSTEEAQIASMEKLDELAQRMNE